MENFIYVPILKTKQNEFSALGELDNQVKDKIKPLFVLTQDDCSRRGLSLSANLNNKWHSRDVFIDICQVNNFNINHLNHVTAIFSDLMNNNIQFTPVIHLDNPNQDAINYVNQHKITSAILLKVNNFSQFTPSNLQHLIRALPNVTDIILDFGSDIATSRQNHSFNISTYISHISTHISPHINIIIAGSSIPSELPRNNYMPFGMEPRTEWLGFYDYYFSTPINNPIIFSDYSITHPNESEPISYVNPNAKIRYTLSDNYLFAVGYQVHSHTSGFGQYHAMAGYIVASAYFMGQNYSWGDKYLYDCSVQARGPGNMGSWVKVGHNHHITFVTRQIGASLYGISI
ncbi:Uncharacterised protein [uncultured Avibacterium sp.]|uniref:Beta protein n=1 Tax=uncultured Avibacterium sp. TaxID=1936169 RepID=A0A486X9Y6_9PAST|nr:Uncharacterised protein [uncultured Avibacterium sp.]